MVNIFQKWIWRTVILVLFAVSLVYLLLQANGFQFDTYTNQFRRTGIIDIAYSNPNAMVYLDGQKLNGTLPFVATNVLPGEYTLVVAEEGYWDYQTIVTVSPDLITRIQSVFLAPMFLQSKTVWTESFAEAEPTFLKGGYFFWQTGKTLKWAKLADNKLEFLSLDIPMERLKNVEVLAKEAVLIDTEGHRGLLDLNSATFQMVGLGDGYRYIGERWLYFQGDVLVLFDRKIERIIWARQPQLGRNITDVKYFNSQGRDFIAVDFGGEFDGNFYELKAGKMILIDHGRVDWVQASQDGQIDYIKNSTSFWSYFAKDNKTKLLVRFSGQVELVSADWGAFGSKGVLLFKDVDGYWLADRSLENARMLFRADEVGDMIIQSKNRLFYHVKKLEEGQQMLNVWNLED